MSSAKPRETLISRALIEIGLALFLVTIVVNALARLLVWSVTRGQPAKGTCITECTPLLRPSRPSAFAGA